MSTDNSRIPEGPTGHTTPSMTQTTRYALVGVLFGFAFPIAATGIALLLKGLAVNPANALAVQSADPLLWIIDTAPVFLGLIAAVAGRRQDALLESNQRLRRDEQALTGLKDTLEQNVADRTQELSQRNALTAALLNVTGKISQSTDVAGILRSIAEEVPGSFGALDATVFLLDQRAATLVLRAASSDTWKRRLAQGYSVDVGGQDLVSQAAARGRLQTAEAVDQSGIISELAFPLSARGRVIGVLGLQPPQPRLMRPHELEVLQLLADQLAAALDSAHLLEESRSSVTQLQDALQEQSAVALREFAGQQGLSVHYAPAGARPPQAADAAESQVSLRVPLTLRGWQIGSIALARPAEAQWSDEERDLVHKVALQAALAIDNNRLLNETRRRALHEQTVSELSARFNQTVEIDTLLRTAVREFASLPGVSEVSIVVRSPEAQSEGPGHAATPLYGYRFNNVRLEPIKTIGRSGLEALEKGASVISDPSDATAGQGQTAAVPLVFREQVLGAVVVSFQRARAPEGSIAMINQAAERMATALENARLLEDSKRKADQETRIAEITAKIGGSISMRNVLETAVEELGHAIPGSEVTIRLHPGSNVPAKEGRA